MEKWEKISLLIALALTIIISVMTYFFDFYPNLSDFTIVTIYFTYLALAFAGVITSAVKREKYWALLMVLSILSPFLHYIHSILDYLQFFTLFAVILFWVKIIREIYLKKKK